MPGRLQKVAALVAAAWGFATPSFAAEAQASARTALELSGSDAMERWSLSAGSSRGGWDPTDLAAFPRFDWRRAMRGEVARANLSFDWLRRIGTDFLEGGAHARLARTAVADGAASIEQRLRESSFGAALSWNGAAALAGLPASHRLGASFRASGRDAEAGAADERGERQLFREDRLNETGISLAGSSRISLPAGIHMELDARYEGYRARVRSDEAPRAGELSAQAMASHLRLTAPVPLAGEVFVTFDRGDAARNLAALIDLRNGAPVAHLDPASRRDTIEIGFRRRLPLGIETTVSMFRARSDLELLLTGENAITEFSRPTLRQGVKAVARYEPARWLALDFLATALRARFADGAGEYVPGAAQRSATATATLRMPKGWSAGLGVDYLGKRPGIDESASLASSTFVNARIARSLSRNTRVSLDLLNLFDQRLRDVDYFSASRLSSTPAEPRGLRLKLRTTF
ncbi:MAG TPA: hypothetical protein VM051_04280 [Usitatibacter sp.]|nr:hypothetical protein [Usitatibacter sp.]